MSVQDQVQSYLRRRDIVADDFEEREEFDDIVRQITAVVEDLNTLPIRQAFKNAEKNGDWIWKHFRELVEVVATY